VQPAAKYVSWPSDSSGGTQVSAAPCIRELLELSSSDCQRVEKLALEKLNLFKAKLRQLRKIESILARTVKQCANRKANELCPIIETLGRFYISYLTPYYGTDRRLASERNMTDLKKSK
jgi:hypothetical protein